jgi:hypothetical protein
MPGSTIRRFGLLLLLVGLGLGATSGPAVAVSSTPARIVAKPNKPMVNTKTTLTGTGFPAKTKLTLEECSVTQWVVTAKRCVGANKISVVTDSHGRFTHKFRVVLCGGKRGPMPTSQVCYIGAPHPQGVDVITLLGAVKVTVTYP